jgi:hypothetical protein
MPSIYGFSLPDGFEVGAAFLLSKKPWRDQSQDLSGARVAIKAGQARVHVALNQIPSGTSTDDLVKVCLPVAQDFLDLLAVQNQMSYRIVHQHDHVVWRRTDNLTRLQISVTLPVTGGMSANAQVICADGRVDSGAPAQSPKAQAAFRYYRFASSSEDLFEAYRYIYLCLESALDDLDPRGTRREKQWLGDALRQAVAKYSLDLSTFSPAALDAVDQFIKNHYVLIRCATFHGKAGALMPGNLSDVEKVDEQMRKIQPIVKQLLKEHFGIDFRSSGMTPYALNSQLERLIPVMWLATSPMDVPDLAQEVRSALTSSGYYDTLPKRPEDITAPTIEKLEQSIHRARELFSFDLTHTTLDGRRAGYDDEWIVTAEAKTDELRHSEMRSMVLFFMFDQTRLGDAFLLLAAGAFSGKTLRTDLNLIGSDRVVYKLRVVLRSFQEFPKEFASY